MNDDQFDADAQVWIEELEPEVCWGLLGRRLLGRVGFVADGELLVLPVNHHVDGHSIVFRTGRTSMFEVLREGARVAFEIDEADAFFETGWSVLIKGTATEVTDPVALSDAPLHPWAPGRRDHWIRIVPDSVTGRSISRQRSATDGHLLPYMPPD